VQEKPVLIKLLSPSGQMHDQKFHFIWC